MDLKRNDSIDHPMNNKWGIYTSGISDYVSKMRNQIIKCFYLDFPEGI